MDRLRRRLAVVAMASIVTGAAAGFGACSDDDDDASPPTEPDPAVTVTTQAPETGGLDIPELDGTNQAPLPSIGFGIAYPEGWQAIVLTADALERLADADLAQPSFLEAARNVADSGAVFYAAGIDEEGRVGELKVDVQDGADTAPAAVADLADQVAANPEIDDPSVVDDLADGRVRVDYVIPGDIETYGSQLFVPDGDRLWSIIVTSEDQVSQDALLNIFASTFTLAD